MRRGIILVVLTLSVGAIGSAIAQERVDRRQPASANGVVTIDNVLGSVTVKGWDRDEVQVTGTLGRRTQELQVEGSADHTTIHVEIDEDERDVGPTDLVIQVPQASRLEIETVSAKVDISGTDGDIRISTVSGEVVSAAGSRTVAITTVNGTIRLVTDQALEDAHFNTVSGKIDVTADLSSKGRLAFETVSGSIFLTLPRRISASFDVSTFSGNIQNDFGQEPVRKDKYLPAKELRFSLGGGDARISMQTLSGTIHLKAQ
jgi:DUF4097 and DUF4098 domain-containing protein YvlB